MNINPSSLNSDFNKEFRELYSIFLQLEETSTRLNKARKADPKNNLFSVENTSHANNISQFAKTFVAFAEKYQPHIEHLTFTPELISFIPSNRILSAVMNELYSPMSRISYVEELTKDLIPQ